jgi:hypothetical protein
LCHRQVTDEIESKPLPYNQAEYAKQMMKKTLAAKLKSADPTLADLELPTLHLKKRHSHHGMGAKEEDAKKHSVAGEGNKGEQSMHRPWRTRKYSTGSDAVSRQTAHSSHKHHGQAHGLGATPHTASEGDFQSMLKKNPHFSKHINDDPDENESDVK